MKLIDAIHKAFEDGKKLRFERESDGSLLLIVSKKEPIGAPYTCHRRIDSQFAKDEDAVVYALLKIIDVFDNKFREASCGHNHGDPWKEKS